MNIWFKLSPRQAHHFQVPWSVANSSNYHFYSTTSLDNLYDADPWILLSFQQQSKRESVITFRPSIVRRQYINEFDAYNPLAMAPGDSLTVTRQELSGLTELLTSYAQHMTPRRQEGSATFERVAVEEWPHFHIYPDPITTVRQRVYLQVIDPLADLRQETAVSLLIVTLPPINAIYRGYRRQSAPRFQITLCQFPLYQLHDPDFSPLVQGKEQLDLDRTGFYDLALLFESLLTELEQASRWHPAALENEMPVHAF